MNNSLKIPIMLFVFSLAATLAFAADDSAVIDGPDYSFTISAPMGWHMTSTKEFQAAFYPAGTTFDLNKSPVIMYVRSVSKAGEYVKTIEDVNNLDLRGIQEQHPKAQSRKAAPARTSDGAAAPVYSFSGGGYFELAAYAEQPKTITIFVLSCDTEKELKASEKAFRALVASYSFISEDVKTSK
jgi:hypothetical protein